MDDEFLNYYNRELLFVREMGAEFAAAHPQEAGQLLIEAGRCEDPHVERMIQAFAFLTARVRGKIDDEYPEITDSLLSIVYPHYQRPIPSTAVVQFTASGDPSKVAGGQVVARGTELSTRPVSGVSCQFRTTYPVALWPVSVGSAALVPDRVAIAGKPAGAVSLLRLGLQCDAQGGWAALKGFDSLRFYLDGGEPVPSSLYEGLFNNLAAVWVQGKDAAGTTRTTVLPPESVRPVGFGADEFVLPYPSRSFPGYRLLQEFFAFPSKFLFFELSGLGRACGAEVAGPVEVLFFLKQPPRTEVVIRPDNFRLGCTPVVNLFEMASEPIRLNHLRTSYPVVPRYGAPLGYEVFSVDRVVSTGSYLEGSVEFQPFYSLRHAVSPAAAAGGREAYWFANRRPSMRDEDDGQEVELAFADAGFSATSPSVETITAHLTCTNRDLPARLPFGGEGADFALESDAPVGRVRLLTRPTRTLRPPTGRSAQWRVVSQLGLNHLSLVENEQGPEALRELLSVYDFAGSAVTRKMIDGVIGVASRQVTGRTGSRLGKTLSLGLEVTVRFDEDDYAGAGAFLMACVLERFLGAYVTINSFTQMVALSKQREGVWKKWPPRCGDRTLL